MKNIKKGFTLVELIVVITILAILGTISYISFGNFTISARDSSRISDIKNLGVVLETFKLNTGIYPKPTNPTAINYSGGVVFWQGTFGEKTRAQMGGKGNISNVPVDPLYKNEYSYSIQSTNRSYNLSYIIEGDLARNNLINKSYAAEQREILTLVKGNYNRQVAHTSTGGKVYVFAIPSLILSDLSETNILNTTDKYVYDKEANIPASYSGYIDSIGTFHFTPKLVYSGSTLPKTPYQLKEVIKNTKEAITGTYLYAKPEYRQLVELDINDSNEVFNWGKRYISEELGGRLKLQYAKTCKEIQNSKENRGTGFYTISPNGYNKIEVYCDMDTDGGGWTRIKKWDRVNGLTEGTDITKTRGIYGNEVMITYTRYGTVTKNGTSIDTTGKKYGFQYKTFKTKQTEEGRFCGEYTNISDLITHLTSGSWGDCARSWDSSGGGSSNNNPLEYNDILVDDLGEDIGLTNDKVLAGFDPDPCINNGHKTTDRNVSWSADGRMLHRIDSQTSLIRLGGNVTRCNGNSDNSHGFQSQEIWVR